MVSNFLQNWSYMPLEVVTKSFDEIEAELKSYKHLLYHKYNVTCDSELLAVISNLDFNNWEKIDQHIETIEHIKQYLHQHG